jgi:rubrerythrin
MREESRRAGVASSSDARRKRAVAAYTAEDLLDFAIEREQEAHDFYVDLAGRAEQPDVKELLTQFAREELEHKKKLEEIKSGSRSFPAAKDVTDLKISDYVVEVEPGSKLNYEDALILAMKREAAAFSLYADLSKLAGDEELKRIFLALAQEEAKHKRRFELEYREASLDE